MDTERVGVAAPFAATDHAVVVRVEIGESHLGGRCAACSDGGRARAAIDEAARSRYTPVTEGPVVFVGGQDRMRHGLDALLRRYVGKGAEPVCVRLAAKNVAI